MRRLASPSDGRSQTVQLTPKGEALFAKIFPAHIAHVRRAFASVGAAELEAARAAQARLREALEGAAQS